MIKTYVTEKGKKIQVENAEGKSGIIIRNYFDNTYSLRVYSDEAISNFTDYQIRHDDLSVLISDKSASFYKDNKGNAWLDCDPLALNYKEIK